MSEDIQKLPTRPRQLGPLKDDWIDWDLDRSEKPLFPLVVTVAGVLWMSFGCLIVLGIAMSLLSAVIAAANYGTQLKTSDLSGAGFGAIIGGMVAFLFIRIGVQSERGIARDTLGNGIGSMLFALLPFAAAAHFASRGKFIQACVEGFVAVMLLAAGSLALAGRSQYKLWRKTRRTRNPFRK